MGVFKNAAFSFAGPMCVQARNVATGRQTHVLQKSSFCGNVRVECLRMGGMGKRRRGRGATMLIPPAHYQLPLTDEEKLSDDYKWDPSYPGTLKPGTVPDNYPLEDVLDSEVYEKMVYEELGMDERHPSIYEQELDEDFLEWLDKEGRLIPRDSEDEDMFESETDNQVGGITEDDLDYGDDDSKMIAYYSRQGDVSSPDFEFGNFSESTFDYDAGY